MTQEQLADELYVSGKTVSKWERGLGYPEIYQLLNLSRVFGVSIDRLLRAERYGIAAPEHGFSFFNHNLGAFFPDLPRTFRFFCLKSGLFRAFWGLQFTYFFEKSKIAGKSA